MTLPTTNGTPTCAADCGRLELRPAHTWLLAWTSWLALCGAAVLSASALPGWVRGGLLLGFLSCGGFWVRRTVWLRGARALRAVEWKDGAFQVDTGAERRLPAVPCEGCRRYGTRLWILRFETPAGHFAAVVDGAQLEPAAIRRLARSLRTYRRGLLLPSRPRI